MLAKLKQQDDHFLKESITLAEDERTVMAKADTTDERQKSIDKGHDKSNATSTPTLTQQVRNSTY